MSLSRGPSRLYLAGLLNTALVGTGKPVNAVYGHLPADFGQLFKVVTVSSGPAGPGQYDLSGICTKLQFTLYVDLFVRYSDGAGWTEANSEDALDEIYSLIVPVIFANQSKTDNPSVPWSYLSYPENQRSEPGSAVIGGKQYRWESIPVEVEIEQ